MKTRLIIAAVILVSVFATAAQDEGKEIRISSKRQGYLGVGIQDVTPKFARENELKIKEGAFVNEVMDDSPADSAGIKKGDVIVEFNGKKVETAEDLTAAVREVKSGTKVNIKINRNGENKMISATVGRNKLRTSFSMMPPEAPNVIVKMFGDDGDIEGMELMDVKKQLAEYFEIPGGKGVLVKNVEKDENAAKAGIKAGDIITKFGSETVTDVEDIREAAGELEEGDKVNVELLRKGKKMTVSLVISEDAEERGGHIYMRRRSPGSYNFHMQPDMDRMHQELEMQLKELPRKKKEMDKIKSEILKKERSTKEIES